MELDAEERQDDLNSLGVQQGGLESLIQATYHLPGLRTSFTTGPKGNRAGTIRAQAIGWHSFWKQAPWWRPDPEAGYAAKAATM